MVQAPRAVRLPGSATRRGQAPAARGSFSGELASRSQDGAPPPGPAEDPGKGHAARSLPVRLITHDTSAVFSLGCFRGVRSQDRVCVLAAEEHPRAAR